MKKLIVANWKMNPQDIMEAKQKFLRIRRKTQQLHKIRTVICPPSIFLQTLGSLKNSNCHIGAQNSFWRKEGAYTGEISPSMIKKLGAEYVLLGHSERRAMGEDNELINKKIRLAIDYRLNVILCVGELERDTQGEYLNFIKCEIQECLTGLSKTDFSQIIIAYEPIWAISDHATGVETPDDFLEQSIYIRKVLSTMVDRRTRNEIPILYGGSVDGENALGYLRDGGADGLLVGHASLDPIIFNEILEQANSCPK